MVLWLVQGMEEWWAQKGNRKKRQNEDETNQSLRASTLVSCRQDKTNAKGKKGKSSRDWKNWEDREKEEKRREEKDLTRKLKLKVVLFVLDNLQRREVSNKARQLPVLVVCLFTIWKKEGIVKGKESDATRSNAIDKMFRLNEREAFVRVTMVQIC